MAFLHVLKVTGLFLAWGVAGVIALLLLAVSLVMFVPVRYKAYANERHGPYEVRLGWMLHILNGWLTVERGRELSFGVRVFTHEILGEEADARRIKKEEKRRAKGEKKRKGRGVVKAKAAPDEDSRENPVRKFGKGLNDFVKKLTELSEKEERLADFLEDKRVRETVAWGIKELKTLIRAVRPRKVRANIRFGFEDPSKTGMLLGAFGFLYTFLGDSLRVEPDFSCACFEADGFMKGRAFLIVPTVILLKCYFSKDLKYTMEKAKNIS